jgi:hypothetical protein
MSLLSETVFRQASVVADAMLAHKAQESGNG